MRRALCILRVTTAVSSASATACQTPVHGVLSKRFHATAAAAATSGRKRHAHASAAHKPVVHARRPRPHETRHHARPKVRVANVRVSALLASHTASADFVDLCEQLQSESQEELLAGTDLSAWNTALRNRLHKGDLDGAHALLALLLNFDAQHASDKLWSDLVFSLLRQRSPLGSHRNVVKILGTLRHKCGDEFVGRVIVPLVNGCANTAMFSDARMLAQYHVALEAATPLPSRVVGNLVSKMEAKGQHEYVVAFTDALLKSNGVEVADVQAQVWISLFRSCTETKRNASRYVDLVIQWFEAVKDRPAAKSMQDSPQFERVLGAVVQSCLATSHERPALRLFHAMTDEGDPDDEEEEEGDDGTGGERRPERINATADHRLLLQHQSQPQTQTRIVRPDENIYVNVLKACSVLHDSSLFHDVYRRMVSDNVARHAGFGSAIRFAHLQNDYEFLVEVLDDAFAVEETSRGKWYLPLAQYNDALGCFAETQQLDHAKELFSRLLHHPHISPDHITMTEMVENYREAPFSDMFDLMEVFLELDLKPNKHVYTSLLATCGRHRMINDAMALLAAMKTENLELDVKTYTTMGFIYAVHGHLAGIVSILQEMKTQKVETDAKFFDTTLDGLYGAHGIDMCFSLFRDMLSAGLRIPKGMYASLIRIGTNVGLVERTLHIAYNMECEGIPLSSTQLLALMRRCEANSEVTELVRTFLLLHQGRQAVGNMADDGDEEVPRFSIEVYEEMVSLLTAFSQRDAIAKVKQLAESAGYDMS